MSSALSQSPARTSRLGSALVLLEMAAVTPVSFLGRLANVGITVFIGGMVILALRKREPVPVHFGLLLVLFITLVGLPFFLTLWPLPLLLALGIYGFVARRSPWLRSSVGWLRPGRLGVREIGLIAAAVAISGLGLILWTLFLKPDLSDLKTRLPDLPLVLLVFGGILFSMVNAIAEEFLYRGAMLEALEAAMGPGLPALAIQAVSFGLLHIHGFPRGWVGCGLAAIYGLMAGIIRKTSRGMVAPWLAHVFADTVIVIILIFLA